MGVTAELARFAVNLSFDELPAEVVHHAKLCVLDTLGCGLFGSTLPWSDILSEYLVSRGGLAESRLWGRNQAVPVEAAVLANGTFVHGFEMDDLHPRSILHPGAVTLPVVLALAESRGGLSGREALVALVAGYEVGARVGMSVGAQELRRGFHPTGTLGPFAAAAAAGKILGLGVPEMVHAIGIGGSQAAGLMAAQYASMVKRFHAGRAAQSGVYGALLAQRGFTGISNIVEAEYGGFSTTYAENPDWAAITDGLGSGFEILKVGFKPYCCCGSTHTSLDAVKGLLGTHAITARDVRHVRIYTTKATQLHVGWEYRPESITTAQMNLFYCVAALLQDGQIFVDQFRQERLADPAILDWIRRIQVRHDPALDELGDAGRHTVRVEMELKNGSTVSTEVRHAWGSSHNPMSEPEVREKYQILAQRAIPSEKAHRLEDMVDRMDVLRDIRELIALL